MENIDYKKKFKTFYKPSAKKFSIVDLPPLPFLMIDGKGDPNTSAEYKKAVEALYSASYSLRAILKKEHDFKFTVPPLEGLWWAEDMQDFAQLSKDDWLWTMMILQPEKAKPELIAQAIELARGKKKLDALELLRYEEYSEGKSAQILYFGPYADEGPSIQKLHAFIEEQGSKLRGKHHEIYLSDPRKTAPEKLKTIIRQPMD